MRQAANSDAEDGGVCAVVVGVATAGGLQDPMRVSISFESRDRRVPGSMLLSDKKDKSVEESGESGPSGAGVFSTVGGIV